MKILRQFVLVVLAVVITSACASDPKARVVTTYQAAEIGLGAVQDAERVAFAQGVIPRALHEQTISPAFARAFEAQITFGHALLIWKPGTQVPQGYDAWLATITNTIDALKDVAPKHRALLDAVIVWARQAVGIIQQFKQTVPPSLAAVAEQ